MRTRTETLHDAWTIAEEFYRKAMGDIKRARIPFLVGGAYALEHYTGIIRRTKDFDIFVHPGHARRTLDAFTDLGYKTELTFPHWLGKIYSAAGDLIDIIFSSGNGIAAVDEEWFLHCERGRLLGTPVRLCPAEEMIWSKSFIMERERYDGADVIHLFRARADRLDWQRLLARFGDHWRLLLGYLVLFGFVYPAERDLIPRSLLTGLLDRLRKEEPGGNADGEQLCQGTLLSRTQYLIDIQKWGYRDARLPPNGPMSQEAIRHWTAAIDPYDVPRSA